MNIRTCLSGENIELELIFNQQVYGSENDKELFNAEKIYIN